MTQTKRPPENPARFSTIAYKTPEHEPSEAIVSHLLQQYGIQEGSDRPDLVVLDRRAHKAVAVIEVKYFTSAESDSMEALRAAVAQLVRYARGYQAIEDLDSFLDHSIATLLYAQNVCAPDPRPYGLPWVIDFEGVTKGKLESWAHCLVSRSAMVAAS